ncbi:sulfur carrier protein ThiS [Conexibacter sp. SYSU D00693]|uniref:sulfur carrier protein ThiS n=1 Tax=Conexibacter sp. SYSU D00693 TaxID=2812560 RepID=UPI00196B3572|nr:sulfur carrier protein ThiS [Conexibacter sp. SYSU D00693]
MSIVLNGEPRPVADGTTVAALLAELELGHRGVAVAVDAEVVPRSAWEDHVLPDGARVEVVHAVQGG